MKIRSSFRDYYDGVQRQGVDTGLTYLRITREQPLPRDTFFHLDNRYGSDYTYDSHVIGFCGNVHFALAITMNSYSRVCLNMDDVEDFMKSVLSKQQWEHYDARKGTYYWDYKHFGRKAHGWPYRLQLADTFKRLAEENSRLLNKQQDVFVKEHTPIFYTMARRGKHYYDREHYLVINGDLKPFHFQRLYDPYTAYQEVAMFLGSLAVPLKPIPKIDDKIMSEIKGFDKYSFRKDKSK
jgi:hypothetical protein